MSSTHFPLGDWYVDAPKYYDMIFGGGTAQETKFLLGCVAQYGQKGRQRVLEPACGTGRLMDSLAQHGAVVHGFDDSPEMLAFAGERLKPFGQAAHLFRARMQQFVAPARYSLAHTLVSTFKYVLHEAEARAHLQLVHDCLQPKGIYVLGLHLSDYTDERRSRERWFAKQGPLRVTCNIQGWPADRRSRRERVRSRLLVQRGTQRRKLETNWDFRTYDAAQLRRLLRSVPGFEHVATYDFCHDLARERALNDDQLDTVLVLRRR